MANRASCNTTNFIFNHNRASVENKIVVNMFLMFCILIFHQFCPVSGMSIQHLGGGTDGDPAPGRSPGPPLLDDGNPTIVLTANSEEDVVTKQQLDCYSNNVELNQISIFESALNLTVTHSLFHTDYDLVQGVVYQVTVSPSSSSSGANRLVEFFLSTLTDGGASPPGQFQGVPSPLIPYIDEINLVSEHPCDSAEDGGDVVHAVLTPEAPVYVVNWTMPVMGDRSNVTFRLRYTSENKRTMYEANFNFTIRRDCDLHLQPSQSNISWTDIPPHLRDCQVHFPVHIDHQHGLVVELTRLNVPCRNGGFLQFFSFNATAYHGHYRTHQMHQTHRLCGKLEELQDTERHLYFPPSNTPQLHFHGSPIFSLKYRLVDYCYSVNLTTQNGSFELNPNKKLECTFKIHLPYGYRIAVKLQTGPIEATTKEIVTFIPVDNEDDSSETNVCDGVRTKLYDGSSSWSHCARRTDPQRTVEIVSRVNSVVLKIDVDSDDIQVGVKVWYRAEPIADIVQQCAFGWVSIKQFCVSIVESVKLSWYEAEMECVKKGGHLISIRSEKAQTIVDEMLLHSPGYKDHNAYWIGASDKTYEGDFRWSDGLPFSYSNWFPGWRQHGHYNKQPNDDGLSEQDCVEVRRSYHLPSTPSDLSDSFYWNDRYCSTLNYFICERLVTDEPIEDGWPPECNRSVVLTRSHSRALLTSPGFPRPYPDQVECETDVSAPLGYRLVVDFEELVLETEPMCSYDFLEIIEYSSSNTVTMSTTSSNISSATAVPPVTLSSVLTSQPRRLCGDWSSKLKLLRHVSKSSRLKLRFVSDYSHHFGGYKARVFMENAMECADDRLHMFNQSCYLFVSYPEVTWLTAQQICRGMRANLASVLSPEEERFVTSNIRKTAEYSTSAIYWIGGRFNMEGKHEWSDGSTESYSGWLPGQSPEENDIGNNPSCLGIQWTPSPTPMLPSGLYWQSQKCSSVGGYVCKKKNQISGHSVNFNKTVNGSEGRITSPNYPGTYYNNLNYWVRIVGPERTRLVIQFSRIDIESQLECLYDFIEVYSVLQNHELTDKVKWCGAHDINMERFNFISQTNEAILKFYTDYSVSGTGFSANWHAIDVSGCPMQTLTAREGEFVSPNYPNFLLPSLDCTTTILAPFGNRIWLEFTDYDLGLDSYESVDDQNQNNADSLNEAVLVIDLGGDNKPFRPFRNKNLITDGVFLSSGDKIQIKLRTSVKPTGFGFKAKYRSVSILEEERIINLSNTTYSLVSHLNYPREMPSNIDFTQHLIAPLGSLIVVELYRLKFSADETCSGGSNALEVFDNYGDKNGTRWLLCEYTDEESILYPPSLSINSYLNTLHVRQKSTTVKATLNGSVRILPDNYYKVKLLKHEDNAVETCRPNPCQNDGKCISLGNKNVCKCTTRFTGLFCGLTVCEVQPCVYGQCELTETGYQCQCIPGYTGEKCEQKRRACDSNPCEGRGICHERNNVFYCQCHAWWEGNRCERRMMHIPFKPLSERMLHEPFWLGLITVTVVLGIIGCVWCAKRHFPEKLEKLLAEEADRNRPQGTSIRGSSVREQLAGGVGSTTGVMVSPSPQQGSCPRSLFGRLGIRKPSLLSLTSPHGVNNQTTARTFSLDDLLRPPPRRTPSPRKKRNNSTPTKKNAAEKKQILQQLISPAASQQRTRKMNIGELMQLSDQTKGDNQSQDDIGIENAIKETDFGGTDVNLLKQIDDPKMEKKVTFAKLLSKVSAEMSSGSEVELSVIKPTMKVKSASTPPSPAADVRSPHSTSSNQGSDSLSSLEVCAPGTSGSVTDMLNRKNSMRLRGIKPASADSILAMFKNFSSSTAGANLFSSMRASPSTTPTASSPQEDIGGDDDSPTSSIHTPISFSSGPPDSPTLYSKNSHNIEVPVLDHNSGYKIGNNGNLLQPPSILLEIPSGINKCLSPIRELPTPLPTPMPSPAITPMRQRSPICSSNEDIGMDMSDDRISIELPCISISMSEADDDDLPPDIAIDIHAEDGLIQEEAAAMSQSGSIPSSFRMKIRPPPIGQGVTAVTITDKNVDISNTQSSNNAQSSSFVIPTLIIETPSPTHRTASTIFPGSPPPQRAIEVKDNNNYGFPSKHQRRGLLKEFDKPTSLDLPCAPPMITITFNLSEAESDAESISPANKNNNSHLGVPSSGMSYLSPFSICSRADRTASESNLSSSGYSSMASPGPSRCGSNNPLCPPEMEDPGPPGSGATNLHTHQMAPRRPSPLLKTSASTSSNNADSCSNNQEEHCRGRSDSETFSDDPLLESNDEGIGTDHLDEKIEDGELKSAKELEVFIGKELIDSGKTLLGITTIAPPSLNIINCGSVEEGIDRLLSPLVTKSSLQLPSIVVQSDSGSAEKLHLSPVSSRSESPLSDKTLGLGQFSPQFYGRYNKDQLPFTDSDGLYDFPSSDCPLQTKPNLGGTPQQHRKSTGRRREKKSCKTTLKPHTSPTKAPTCLHHLDIPGTHHKEHHKIPAPRKLSPKRRIRTQACVSSSSSSESLNSAREIKLSSSSSPDTVRWPSAGEWSNEKCHLSTEASGEETEDATTVMLPKVALEDIQKPHKKFSRLRTISHQIRFLRRLEQSLKKKERQPNLSDSIDSVGEEEDEEDDNSPHVTSPLLQSPKSEIQKPVNITKIQTPQFTSTKPRQVRKGKRTGSQMLIPQDDRKWTKVPITGNGFSD